MVIHNLHVLRAYIRPAEAHAELVVHADTMLAGTLAAAVVAKATSDGHTLLMISSAFAIGAVLQPT